jgi:type II secretory pathway component GspD/PulD (secretin)
MQWTRNASGRNWKSVAGMFSGLALGAVLVMRIAGAQTASTDAGPVDVKPNAEAYQTFYLANLTQPNEANDVVNDLRNMVPRAKAYYVASENAISMRGTPEDIALAKRVLADMDRTRRLYRVTYTITETDGGKQTGTRQVALIVAAGDKTVVKQGRRVPIVTSAAGANSSAENSQVQYVDVGLNIEASLEGNSDGLRLRSRVEQSNIAEEKSGVGVQDPVILQTRLDGVSTLAQGKPVVLGSLDAPGGTISGSTRREEIAVVSELVR